MLWPTLALATLQALGDPLPVSRPGDHAPAGVPDVHCPKNAPWMFSLTSTYTAFDGLRDGSKRIDTDDALGSGYTQVPESMETSRTTLGLMYSATDALTLSASVPWMANSITLRTNLGERFSMDSSGIGDVQVGADLVAWQLDEQSVSCGLGLGIPTGSITETGGMPGAPAGRLEYAMQLGSGTYDLMPRLDWRMSGDPYSYGVALLGVARMGHNSEDYALGDRFSASAWGAQEWSASWSGSARVTAARWANVRGADPNLDPTFSPTHDRALQGGQRLDGALGVNWLPFKGRCAGSVIGLELGMPLAEDLDGPQSSEEWFAALHVGISF